MSRVRLHIIALLAVSVPLLVLLGMWLFAGWTDAGWVAVGWCSLFIVDLFIQTVVMPHLAKLDSERLDDLSKQLAKELIDYEDLFAAPAASEPRTGNHVACANCQRKAADGHYGWMSVRVQLHGAAVQVRPEFLDLCDSCVSHVVLALERKRHAVPA